MQGKGAGGGIEGGEGQATAGTIGGRGGNGGARTAGPMGWGDRGVWSELGTAENPRAGKSQALS